MKNILEEGPTLDLRGRLGFSLEFVGADAIAGNWLDIGCGFGWFEQFALQNGVTSIVGIEVEDDDLRSARRLEDDVATFVVASALELPFEDDSFDGVAMWEVLEHLPAGSEPVAFAEIARVLRPGGRLFLSTPHATLLTVTTDPARWLIGHRHYSVDAVRNLATGAGLSVQRAELHGGAWEIAHMLDLYFSKWVLRRRPLFDEQIQRRVDREWRAQRPGFVHVFLEARKSA